MREQGTLLSAVVAVVTQNLARSLCDVLHVVTIVLSMCNFNRWLRVETLEEERIVVDAPLRISTGIYETQQKKQMAASQERTGDV
ncbi:hypothetical protein PI124_g8978 [Phytophthora idaei]|nr:hypothetical protein PI124_g8978 [Phytophthora idaei]